jgi:hypothetical protein
MCDRWVFGNHVEGGFKEISLKSQRQQLGAIVKVQMKDDKSHCVRIERRKCTKETFTEQNQRFHNSSYVGEKKDSNISVSSSLFFTNAVVG